MPDVLGLVQKGLSAAFALAVLDKALATDALPETTSIAVPEDDDGLAR